MGISCNVRIKKRRMPLDLGDRYLPVNKLIFLLRFPFFTILRMLSNIVPLALIIRSAKVGISNDFANFSMLKLA